MKSLLFLRVLQELGLFSISALDIGVLECSDVCA